MDEQFTITFRGICMFVFPLGGDRATVVLPDGMYGYSQQESDGTVHHVESHTAYIAAPADRVLEEPADWPDVFDLHFTRIFPIGSFVELTIDDGFSNTAFSRRPSHGDVPAIRRTCETFTLSTSTGPRAAQIELTTGDLGADLIEEDAVFSSLTLASNNRNIRVTATPPRGLPQQIVLAAGTSFIFGNECTDKFQGYEPRVPNHWLLYYKLADPPVSCGLPGDTTVGCSNSSYP